jgi:RNA methyltransferase, TrmH family
MVDLHPSGGSAPHGERSSITSLQNPLVKRIKRLHQASARQREGVFLLEGTHLLLEAEAVDWPLEVVCATPPWQDKHGALWQRLQERSPRTETVSPGALAAMATTVNPDGVMAVAQRQSRRSPPVTGRLMLLLDRLQDPGNLGTIIRTATAAGADGLWTTPTGVELEHPKVLRASAGQWFKLPMALAIEPVELVGEYRRQGGQVVATAMAGAVDYWDVDFSRPTMILLGNEGGGLDPELLAQADHAVRVPMDPAVESLNVAITAALLLYEARRFNRADAQ